jgi:uncharacterized OB-fold protein
MSKFPISFTLEFPYQRTLGPILGPFMTALRDGKLLGIRAGNRVICPPVEFNPETLENLAPDFVEVGPAGRVECFTWVAEPSSKHPFQVPFAFAEIKLDGADTTITHAVKASGPDAIATGMRVKVQFREQRSGTINDIYFVPEQEAVAQEITCGEGEVAKFTHRISLVYKEHLYPSRASFAQGLLDGKFIGQKSPVTGKVSIPSKGYDNVSGIMLGPEHYVELASTGTAVSYTVITPIQYQGQTKTEPYVSAVIFLDGADQPLAQQEIHGIPASDFRVGMRLRAIFKPKEQRSVASVCNSWAFCTTGDVIERWEPTGEPDVAPEDFPDYI